MKSAKLWMATGLAGVLPIATSAQAQYPQIDSAQAYSAPMYPAPIYPGQVPYYSAPQPLLVPEPRERCDGWNALMRAYGVCWGSGYHAPPRHAVTSVGQMDGAPVTHGFAPSVLPPGQGPIELPDAYYPRPHDMESDMQGFQPTLDSGADPKDAKPKQSTPSRLKPSGDWTKPGEKSLDPDADEDTKDRGDTPDSRKSDDSPKPDKSEQRPSGGVKPNSGNREELPLGPESEPKSPSDSDADLLLNGFTPSRAVTVQPVRRTTEVRSAQRRIEEPRSPFSKVRR